MKDITTSPSPVAPCHLCSIDAPQVTLTMRVADMGRFSSGGMYLNFPGFFEEGDNLMHNAFGANYERLVEIKYEYDPTNLFRLDQNIKPTVS